MIRAYEKRCAVCALNHPELLDAAHIVPDSEDAGIAAVRNGLSLCKIHHAAFDQGFLGIRPDLVVQIRTDLLEERDAPMLLHGLRGRHGQPLMSVPRSRIELPDPQLLRQSYERFRAGRGAAEPVVVPQLTAVPRIPWPRARGVQVGRIVDGRQPVGWAARWTFVDTAKPGRMA